MGRLAGIAVRPAKRAPMRTLEAATVSPDSGVADDFRGRPGQRQVTVLSADAWRAACADVGRELPWTTRRANLLVDGVDLPQSHGAIVRIGDVRLRVTMETAPCERMDEQCSGLRAALMPGWRGGVCCEVLAGGQIRVGDAVFVDRETST